MSQRSVRPFVAKRKTPHSLARQPTPTNEAKAQFLALGQGARTWLVEAAAAGTERIKVKMAEALTLSRLHDPARAG